jgi:uncharacterized membrane protein
VINVTLYHRTDCPGCAEIEENLVQLQSSVPHQLIKVNINSDADLQNIYSGDTPVVQIGPYRLTQPITRQDLLASLGAARDRHQFLERSDPGYKARVDRGQRISKTDEFSYWISRRYMIFFNLVVFLYVGLPFLAPTLMKANVTLPARAIYTVYSPLCHQFAFRSWFIYGEQTYYPRQLAMIDGVITYERLSGAEEIDLVEARRFVGNDQVGYKVALCQRDIAMYGGIFLFGLVFSLTGRRLRSVPWYLWLLLGVVPIGWDGASQLPSLMNIQALEWLPIRESSPLLRSVTGALFGIMTAWYIYPLIENAMRETRYMLARKMAVVRQSQSHKNNQA